MVAINDYAYLGIEFQGDPDLVLPDEAQWGEIGKNVLTMFFDFFKAYTCFCIFMFSQD